MKKILFLLLTVCSLVACDKNYYETGYSQSQIVTFTIYAEDWQLVGDPNEINSYYTYIFNTREITSDIYYNGSVTGYLVQDEGTNNEVQTPLPYVLHLGDDVNPFWTETYTFDFMPGSIAFYVRYSDFATQVVPPTCTFRMVLRW